jgi:DNA-binding NarL/FixJ family response regulator
MRPAYVRPRGSTAATDSADSSTSITEPRLEPNPNFETLQALAAAARAEPDVAVIDVLMPTMSGIECAHLLQERYPKARVILISGSIFEDKRPHPDERGTDAYLEKSEVPERLHATILALAAETTAAPPSRTNA